MFYQENVLKGLCMKKFSIRLYSWPKEDCVYIISDNFHDALQNFLHRFCNGIDYMELDEPVVVKWFPVE